MDAGDGAVRAGDAPDIVGPPAFLLPFQAEDHRTEDREYPQEDLADLRGLYHVCCYDTSVDARQGDRHKFQCGGDDPCRSLRSDRRIDEG